jgi:hypothetical protein
VNETIVLGGFWSGGGGLLGAVGTVLAAAIGLVGGWLLERKRNSREDKKEQVRRTEERRGAARGIADVFDSAAAALRVASKSHGSLKRFAYDEEALKADTNRIRRDVAADVWTEIQKIVESLTILRYEQGMNHSLPEEDCRELAQSFEDAAKKLRAAHD